jgi:Zn-dependent peptidase ImmA (M78 family)
VAHELGHILLGHVGEYHLVNREPSPHDDPIEQEANGFAARLLAPACVLWGCGASSAEEIAALCDISMAAARYRWERMQILLERDKFLRSPLERKVYKRFSKYIKLYRRGRLPRADR